MLGFKVQKLDIMPIGFGVSFRVDTKNYNKKILKANLLTVKKIIIVLAGPLINLILIFIFSILEYILKIGIDTLIYVNILIFIFNMMPIYPLDGGRILKNILYIFLGKLKALQIVNIISKGVAFVLTFVIVFISVLYQNISYIFVLIYIWIIVIKASKICNMKIKMYKILKNYIAIN